jgi:flavin reductase (DIM6/NTAB) family NADH-FMN oxidoreductase RutF/DNA-binding IclR family transcriptional regulator
MTTTAPPTFDGKWFRRVLGQYPTGVVVVTAMGVDGKPAGLVVGTFTSVSLDPPLVGFLPDKSSTSWPKIQPAGHFCINVLSGDQEDVCRRFASKAPDKFEGFEWRQGVTGAPILDGVTAWIDCDLESVIEAGDHYIVIGRVRDLDVQDPSPPLLFFQGGYGSFTPLSYVTQDVELDVQLHVVDRARREMEELATKVQAQSVALALVRDEVAMLASAGSESSTGMPPQLIGSRTPAIPPIGTTWMAWAEPAQVEAWLKPIKEEEREQFRRRIAQVRERGYSVGLHAPSYTELRELMSAPRGKSPDHPLLKRGPQLIPTLPLDPLDFDFDEAGSEIQALHAPVFDERGKVAILLSLYGLPQPVTREGFDGAVEALLATCEKVTERIGGHRPE